MRLFRLSANEFDALLAILFASLFSHPHQFGKTILAGCGAGDEAPLSSYQPCKPKASAFFAFLTERRRPPFDRSPLFRIAKPRRPAIGFCWYLENHARKLCAVVPRVLARGRTPRCIPQQSPPAYAGRRKKKP